MDIKIDSIQIFVSDIKKAKKWYSDILGMRLVESDSRFKYLLMRHGEIKFYVETPNPKWGEGWRKVKIGGRTPIIFATKDIEGTVTELKRRGVKFVEEISKRPWGQDKAVFADPFGNEFNLVQV